MKSIQIPEDLFLDILEFFFLPCYYDQKNYLLLKESIKNRLLTKVDAINRRNAYTKYKTAATPEEKESALIEYLNQKEETK